MARFPFSGILLAMTAGAFSSSGAAITKSLTGLHPLEIVIFRDIVQLAICLPVAIKSGHSLLGVSGERKYLILRGIFGSVSLSSWYLAVRFTIFGDASAIYYSYPPLITLFAWLALNEPFGWFNAFANVLTVGGILVISGPRYVAAILGTQTADHFSDNDVIGLGLASLGCFAVSCGNLSIRKLQETPSIVVVVWFSVLSMASSAVLVPVLDEYHWPEGWLPWLLLLGVGLCGVCNQLTITLALKIEKAAPVAIGEAFTMVIAFVYQIFLFKEPLQVQSLIGAALIAVAVSSIGLKKYLDNNKENELLSSSIPTIPTIHVVHAVAHVTYSEKASH